MKYSDGYKEMILVVVEPVHHDMQTNATSPPRLQQLLASTLVVATTVASLASLVGHRAATDCWYLVDTPATLFQLVVATS